MYNYRQNSSHLPQWNFVFAIFGRMPIYLKGRNNMKLWDVIEFLNEEKLLLYKHECEDFNTNTKLIVREGQVALFIKNGTLCDYFQPGRYTLKTENIPLLSKMVRAITTGGENSYSAELFFVSTVDQLNLKWGTRTPMDLQDPNYKVIVKVGASGESSFSVSDPLAFIRKLSGTNNKVESSQLAEYFRSIINTYVKNCVSDALAVNKISILEINSCLVQLSDSCCNYLNEKIAEYGVVAKNFTVETINIPNDDPSLLKLKSILEKKAEMEILGYSYQEERSFDVMDKATSNQASAGIANSLMGIGLGFGMASPIAKGVSNIAGVVNTTPSAQQNNGGWSCSCGTNGITSAFCPSCGSKKPESTTAWTCPTCGKSGLSSVFCPDCGTKKISPNWDCSCGEANIASKFCPNCGKARQ